ncbi:UPF0462 protein C4orf33 homolog isoform X2 [Haliotis rufescens]|uniref:UPF0462 protein C4orf33 homolog isoform X1 n=2 Tax=Haliotis rufescens TaxID=6454 RepID=UPI00201EF200|nr:UPF0462 protein C4orf33 homolog isoform X1 [Haliotis rufescens]XP_046355253.2 UPF0462 protein C4orf33 homolog isoform X2 [Haliotis rufescens]
MDFSVTTTWDGESVTHPPVRIKLSAHEDGCLMTVRAPLFNDPPAPPRERGAPVPGLWDYEVVEAFFLNDHDEYLEVELCPHGQHLLLLLKGRRNIVQEQLPLQFTANIDGDTWTGETTLPRSYFPSCVTRFNAYAIHGSGDKRVYEALYPATKGQFTDPDFHRLEFFQNIDMSSVLKSNTKGYTSDIWSKHTETGS